MPNRLLDITVRPDWAAIERDQAERAARTWRGALAALVATLLASLLLAVLAPAWPWLPAARAALFTLVTWGPPLWYLITGAQAPAAGAPRPAAGGFASLAPRLAAGAGGGIGRGLQLVLALGLLAAVTLVTLAAAPARQAAGTRPLFPVALPLPLALLAPATGVGLLLWAGRRADPAFRGLGFVGGDWLYYTLTGAAAGASLGFHLLLILHGLPGTAAAGFTLPRLAWLACYAIGLRAVGEELLLRGLGYHLLSRGAGSLLGVMARLMAANVLLGLLTFSDAGTPALRLLLAAYAASLAAATTLLRYRSGSLAPALACNAVFALFAGGALPW